MEIEHHPEMIKSIPELLLPKLKLYGDRIAMVCGVTGTSYSYSQIFTQVEHASLGLRNVGVQRDDVLCVVCPNCPEFTVLSLATLNIGGIVSTANPALTPAELRRQLVDSEAKFVFCDSTSAGTVKTAVAGTSVQNVIVVGDSPGMVPYGELLQTPIRQPSNPCPQKPSDTALLLYSSGTTGLPKGVMLSHANLVATILQLSHPQNKLEQTGIEQEVFIAALPFFHVFGFGAVQLYGLYHGHNIVTMPRFSLSGYLKLVQDYGATLLHLAPPVVLMIINHPDLARVCDFGHVHTVMCGAAAVGAETEAAFQARTGVGRFVQALGMTESSALCLTPAPGGGWGGGGGGGIGGEGECSGGGGWTRGGVRGGGGVGRGGGEGEWGGVQRVQGDGEGIGGKVEGRGRDRGGDRGGLRGVGSKVGDGGGRGWDKRGGESECRGEGRGDGIRGRVGGIGGGSGRERGGGGKPGSVGLPVSGTDIRVEDSHGNALPPGRQGELCFRGPQVMKGYWKNPEATRRTIDDKGWLHTGDLGYCDADGFVFVTGRLKELIKYKGHQVAPAELESVLLSHPEILDAAVLGVPDTIAGELPMAFVVRQNESDIGESTIIQFVKDRVAPHKQLRGGVRFIATIPKSPSGKILRLVLKKQLTNAKL